jgi:subtilisin family serine protease
MRSRLAALALTALALGTPAPAVAAPRSPDGAAHVPGELVVRFRASADATERRRVRERLGGESSRSLRIPGVHLVDLKAGRSVAAAQAAFERSPEVVYAEPNFRLTYDGFPDDPLFPNQWDLDRIGAPWAWDLTMGSRDVVVAIIDSGVEMRHPDLQGNLWRNPGETGGGRESNGVDDDANGYVDDYRGWDFWDQEGDPSDHNGHGTHAAGVVGAVGGNGIGVSGVSPRVTLMPLRTGGSAEVAEAVAYAARMGVRVANGSFGIPRYQAIEDALAAAPQLLLSVSAGNQAWDVEQHPEVRYPCVSPQPNVICVAATDRNDSLAGFSNWGATSVDLGAPGDDLRSTGLPRRRVLYDEFEGPLGTQWATGGTGAAWGRTVDAGEWTDQWGGWLHDSPGEPYANDSDTWIGNADPIDLTGHATCGLYYYVHHDLAAGDVMRAEVSDAGGAWTVLAEHTGTGSWVSGRHPLTAYEGRPGLRFRFRLISDAADQARGVRLDYVQLWCDHPLYRGDEYAVVGGTSNAAPHVAGTAALLLARNPSLSADQLRARIFASVEPLPSLAGRTVTGGRLDTLRALGGTRPAPPPEPAPEPPAPDVSGPRVEPPPPPVARDARAPRCTTRTRSKSRRAVRLVVSCDEAARAELRLELPRRAARAVRLARLSVAVRAGGRRTVTLSTRRRRARLTRATLGLAATDAAGNRRLTWRRLTLP